MRSTTPSPLVTRPRIAYCGGRCASGAVTTKNWLPLVPNGCVGACGWAAARIIYTELAQSRRDNAADRAAQAQAYKSLFSERASEHAEFTTAMTDRIAAREADAIDAQTRGLVDGLVAGINRQIEAFGTKLPIEFLVLEDTPRPFTVADVVAITTNGEM